MQKATDICSSEISSEDEDMDLHRKMDECIIKELALMASTGNYEAVRELEQYLERTGGKYANSNTDIQ